MKSMISNHFFLLKLTLMSPPWTAEWSGTFPSESKKEIISSLEHPRASPHCKNTSIVLDEAFLAAS